MCYAGGPRCSSEAKRVLERTKQEWRENPIPENKEKYLEALDQYHLTTEGLQTIQEAAEAALENGNTKQHAQLMQKYERNSWERQRLRQREATEASIRERVAALGHPDGEESYLSLEQEGSPFANPSRETIERWAAQTGEEPRPYTGAQFYAIRNLEKRLAYNDLLNSLEATQIDAPGSQRDQYPRDENGKVSEVYYASYGSNMSRERFMAYIEGGSVRGATRVYNGATDKTAPTDDIPLKFNNPVQYAGNSTVWGKGGVGFLDHSAPGKSLGRAYKITAEQFSDVVAQESGQLTNYAKTDVDSALENGVTYDYKRLYGTLVHVGDYNGRPVLTFTAPFGVEDAYYGDVHFDGTTAGRKGSRFYTHAPSQAYMQMIGRGLNETFGLDVEQQATYFVGSPGANKYSKGSVMNALEWTPDDEANVRDSLPPRRSPEVRPPTRQYSVAASAARAARAGEVRRAGDKATANRGTASRGAAPSTPRSSTVSSEPLFSAGGVGVYQGLRNKRGKKK